MIPSPPRCISSYLTTQIAEFRNPQKNEANWLFQKEKIENYWVHSGKVVTAQIATIILCVTATVETVAYTVFAAASLVTLPFTSKYLKGSYCYLSSSGFTIFWNLGNLIVFNPFCTNITTHESFARFSMDHMSRGQVFKWVIVISDLAFNILCLITKTKSAKEFNSHSLLKDLNKPFLRLEDRLFMVDWLIVVREKGRKEGRAIPTTIENLLLQNIRKQAEKDLTVIDEGMAFLLNYFLSSEDVDNTTKNLIKDGDPNVYHYILTRAVFLYVCGERRYHLMPPFFKDQTWMAIEQLRNKYSRDFVSSKELSPLMKSLKSFSQPNENIRITLNAFKIAATNELQGGILITRCLEKALENS